MFDYIFDYTSKFEKNIFYIYSTIIIVVPILIPFFVEHKYSKLKKKYPERVIDNLKYEDEMFDKLNKQSKILKIKINLYL